jgi:hypothetical protein
MGRKANIPMFRNIDKAKLLAYFSTFIFCLQTHLFAAPYYGDVFKLKRYLPTFQRLYFVFRRTCLQHPIMATYLS